MRILAIETSCDETSAAVVERIDELSVKVLSNVTATSLTMHAATGGIIPENAAREQVKYIIPVITRALNESRPARNASQSDTGGSKNHESWESAKTILSNDIDSIAVTYGPGLIGSLLIGVETVKTLAMTFDKPIIPVNHLLAHIFANFIDTSNSKTSHLSPLNSHLNFPFIGLIVSGGHTDLLLFESLTKYQWLGGTRDDAAGEAIDKIGRLLNLPYPAGPEIERRASQIPNTKYQIRFKSPMIDSADLDFSFSGLKSEVARFVAGKNLTESLINQICYALQKAIFDVLVKKTMAAAEKYKCNTILLGGGVSANQTLLQQFERQATSELQSLRVFAPDSKYSTDNAAMIGAYAALNPITKLWRKIESQPDLYFA